MITSLPVHDMAFRCRITIYATKWTWFHMLTAATFYFCNVSRHPLVFSYHFIRHPKAVPEITLIDLVPSTEYYLSVRSHPSENNIVWGWRESLDAPKLCTTTATLTDRACLPPFFPSPVSFFIRSFSYSCWLVLSPVLPVSPVSPVSPISLVSPQKSYELR